MHKIPLLLTGCGSRYKGCSNNSRYFSQYWRTSTLCRMCRCKQYTTGMTLRFITITYNHNLPQRLGHQFVGASRAQALGIIWLGGKWLGLQYFGPLLIQFHLLGLFFESPVLSSLQISLLLICFCTVIIHPL